MNLVELKLYVDNKVIKVDFTNRSDLAPRIYKRKVDPGALESAVGDYTLNLKLPKSIRNIAAFNFTNDLQKSSGFFDIPPFVAEVFVNSTSVLKGNLFVDRITPDAIECTIVGENISWKNIFEERSLRYLRGLRTLRFTGSYGTNYNIWPVNDANTVAFADIWQQNEGGAYDIQFPILPFGNYSSNAPFPNPVASGNVIDGQGLVGGSVIWRNLNQAWFWDEFHPSVYFKTLFKSIFEQAGYNVAGTFIDDSSTDNLLIPYTGNTQNYYDSFNWNLFGKVKIVSDNIVIINIPQNSSYFDNDENVVYSSLPFVNGTFTVGGNLFKPITIQKDYSFSYNLTKNNVFTPATPPAVNFIQTTIPFSKNSFFIYAGGDYNIKLRFGYNGIVGAKVLLVRITNSSNLELGYVDNSLNVIRPFDVIYESAFFTSNGIFEFDENFYLEKGTYKIVIVQAPVSPLYFWEYVEQGNYFEINPLSFDEELIPEKFLPDVKVNEFIDSVIKLFNLQITFDPIRKFITFDYPNDFSLPIGTSINFDKKCNLDEATIEKLETFKQIDFKYTEESDEILGSAEIYNFQYISPNRGLTETKEVSVIFSPTFNRQYTYKFEFTENPITLNLPTISKQSEFDKVLGKLFSGEQSAPSFEYNIRILRYIPNGALPRVLSRFNVGSTEDGYDYNYYNDIPGTILPITRTVEDLAFSNLVPQGGLFSRFYEDQLRKVQKGAIIELPIYLTEIDISNIDFRRPISISGVLFYLLEIDGYNPVNMGTTNCKLLKI